MSSDCLGHFLPTHCFCDILHPLLKLFPFFIYLILAHISFLPFELSSWLVCVPGVLLEMPSKLYLFLDCDLYIKLSSLVPLTFYE